MKAICYEEFGGTVRVQTVQDPVPSETGVILKVGATGLCRSDWHGWQGHDPDIKLPHVPGHELAGTIVEVGNNIRNWKIGDRVTVPFVSGCGHCAECQGGNQHICDNQFQPGFTAWGSFAEYVAIEYADINLVNLPDDIKFPTAAGLGCRFITAFRGIVDQGKIAPGMWVAVHGCGGVGLSAIMIARASGALPIAVDIHDQTLSVARELGAVATVNANKNPEVVAQIIELTGGGAHLSMDALGSQATCYNSVACLRKRGKHIQVGLMAGSDHDPKVPMHLVIAKELELLGSHGMQAHRYPEMLSLISQGVLNPDLLVGEKISLMQAPEKLMQLNDFQGVGMTIIDKF